MLKFVSPLEQKKQKIELEKFCKDNFCLMYNYMKEIKSIKRQERVNIGICVNCKQKADPDSTFCKKHKKEFLEMAHKKWNMKNN